MNKPNLTDVYEALREAEKEGRAKDVEKLVSYIQSVEATPAETYDPKDLVSPLYYSAAGAGAGAVGSEVAKRAISKVEKGRALPATPTASVTVEGVPMNTLADIEEATTKGLSPEITQQTRTAQRAQRTEKATETLARLKAQGVPVDPKILAEMENLYARQGSGLLIPVGEAKNIAAQEAAAAARPAPKAPIYKSAWEAFKSPSFSSTDAANFLKGIVDYRIPFTKIHTGPLLGHGLVGAGAGLQLADALNRETMGDTTGAIISGIGAAGTAASALPWLPAKVAGAGVGLSAEAINAYRDAMRRGGIEHGAPQTYENTDPMGGQYAAGGLAHLANGGQPYSIAPYGFRHVESVEDVSMPKGKGYFGLLPNQAGGVSTEISADSNGMQYPLINPAMSREEIDSLLANQPPTEDMYRKAEQFARYRKSQGKSPFISPIGELRFPLPQK